MLLYFVSSQNPGINMNKTLREIPLGNLKIDPKAQAYLRCELAVGHGHLKRDFAEEVG